jgi:hypothetical protein
MFPQADSGISDYIVHDVYANFICRCLKEEDRLPLSLYYEISNRLSKEDPNMLAYSNCMACGRCCSVQNRENPSVVEAVCKV